MLIACFLSFSENGALGQSKSSPVVRDNKLLGLWVRLESPEEKWSQDPRQEAILEAHREAFRFMSSYVNQAPPASMPSDNKLSEMVESFSVRQEKVNARTYRGRFNFVFKQGAFGRFLSSNTHSSSQESPSLEREAGSYAYGMENGHSSLIQIRIDVRLKGLDDWLKAKDMLGVVLRQEVQSHVVSLSPNQGTLSLPFRGHLGELVQQLEGSGFRVTQHPNRLEIERLSRQVVGHQPISGGQGEVAL